jgi:hypothetical protein
LEKVFNTLLRPTRNYLAKDFIFSFWIKENFANKEVFAMNFERQVFAETFVSAKFFCSVKVLFFDIVKLLQRRNLLQVFPNVRNKLQKKLCNM